MLVHGFTQSGASWRRVAELVGAGRAVVAPDLPGHGRSPRIDPAPGDPGDVDRLAATGRALAAAAGRGTYVGYSLGGRCCLHLALGERRAAVDRLVLVGAHPGIVEPEAREQRRAADDELARRLELAGDEGLPSFVDEWLAGPLFAHLDVAAADRPSRLVNTASGLAWALRHLSTGIQAPLWDRLGEIEIPVLVVSGADDDKFRAIGERTASAIGANARVAVVQRAGHAAPFEQPEAFVELLEAFLAET